MLNPILTNATATVFGAPGLVDVSSPDASFRSNIQYNLNNATSHLWILLIIRVANGTPTSTGARADADLRGNEIDRYCSVQYREIAHAFNCSRL